MSNLHSISILNIDGSPLAWEKFEGKKILIINTASECGYTPQYTQMQELYNQYGDRLEIVGVPCNDFGDQEPGGAEDIANFCTKNYGVTFTLTEKVNIVENRHPLYQWLMDSVIHGDKTSPVKWNFHKFLIDDEGNLIGSFPSSMSPIDAQIVDML